jgi:hypothetical protein
MKDKVLTPKFDWIILVFIIISSIHLVLDNPLKDPEGNLAHVLLYIDYILTAIFSIEAIMKILTFGFLLNGKDSYLKSTWNIIDFSIVIISILSASLPTFNL